MKNLILSVTMEVAKFFPVGCCVVLLITELQEIGGLKDFKNAGGRVFLISWDENTAEQKEYYEMMRKENDWVGWCYQAHASVYAVVLWCTPIAGTARGEGGERKGKKEEGRKRRKRLKSGQAPGRVLFCNMGSSSMVGLCKYN